MKRSTTHDRSWTTNDRGPPDIGSPTFLTVESLGPKRELMKNGYLVCYDVPIARTGWMLYMQGEVPVAPNPTSPSIYVERTADELFNPSTIASFMGAGLVNEHPNADMYPLGVTADNAKDLVGGFIQNVRRGKSEDGDGEVLLADIVVTHRPFIEAIQSGKREISAGYDASYETVRPGIGRQRNIIANHIALVDKGRCGPRCAIGDHATTNLKEQQMPQAKQDAPARRRLSAEDLDGLQSFIDGQRAQTQDAEAEGVHVHVHMGNGALTVDKKSTKDGDEKDDKDGGDEDRIGKIEKTVDTLAATVNTLGESMKAMMSDRKTKDSEGDDTDNGDGSTANADKKTKDGEEEDDKGDKGKKTEDSAALATSYQELMSKAEILVPGFKVPTFDSALPRAKTVDAMCSTRRKALAEFMATDAGKAVVASMTTDSVPDMGCQEVAILFNAAAAARATANNTRATQDSSRIPGVQQVQQVGTVSAQSLGSAYRNYWSQQNGARH